jgi:hypothetical protein
MSDCIQRREFLQMSAGAAAVVTAPTILTAKKTDSPIILGSSGHRFEVIHDWPQLPDKFRWQTTHNVAVDRAGNLYVIHQGEANQPDHPAIFLFLTQRAGTFDRLARSFRGAGTAWKCMRKTAKSFSMSPRISI